MSGFVEQLAVPSGQQVAADELLLTMRAPDLAAEAKVLAAQVNEARIRYQASVRDRSGSEILLQELRFIEQEFERARERLASLRVYSNLAGEFVVPDIQGLKGALYSGAR
ncbi:biotin/lipoyl-binding protein [Aliamphritea spongicola]|nr:biotin/lipoyl-binding protein [Aliamphritea spongicola]